MNIMYFKLALLIKVYVNLNYRIGKILFLEIKY